MEKGPAMESLLGALTGEFLGTPVYFWVAFVAIVIGLLVFDLGILHKDEQVALRVTYVVDPNGVIRSVSATDLNVGRNVDEVVRVLDALQTDELCPCNWKKGEDTLKAA